jgi:beta-lactam-binding protein with PASTA domain
LVGKGTTLGDGTTVAKSAPEQIGQAAGLVLGTVSLVVDGTCDNIGTVMSQNPGPGTTLLPGSSVNIAIGKSPPPPRQCI